MKVDWMLYLVMVFTCYSCFSTFSWNAYQHTFQRLHTTCLLYVLELEDKPIRVPAYVILGKDGTV